MDNKIELFEWSIQKIIKHNLAGKLGQQQNQRARYKRCRDCKEECLLLLSVLWHAGHNDDKQRDEFTGILASLELSGTLRDRTQISLNGLNDALDKLNLLYPLQKPALLKACTSMIALDGKITATESELFRAIAEILDCPVPPLLANTAAQQ